MEDKKHQKTGDRKPETGNRKYRMRVGQDIAERLINFAVAVLRLTKQFPKDVAGRHVAGQLIRSSTSSGANYEEARAAESRGDFVHKVGIAAKEMRESILWLEIVHRAAWTKADMERAIDEAEQLAAILSASANTARKRDR